jgi:hypothetical protein
MKNSKAKASLTDGKQSGPSTSGTSNIELNAARKYWQQIELATLGRWLHGVELAIAQRAWSQYAQQVRSAVEIWIIGQGQDLREYAQWVQQELLESRIRPTLRSFERFEASILPQESIVIVIQEHDVSEKTAQIAGNQTAEPIQSVFAHLSALIESRLPSEPKTATLPNISAAELANVAGQLALQAPHNTNLPINPFFSQAREILIQAASYITELRVEEVRDVAFEASGITFDEILGLDRAELKNSLKLLPGFTGGTKSKGSDRHKGLKQLIRRFYSSCSPPEDPQRFIDQGFLPIKELLRIREWSFRQRRRAALKPTK